MPDEWNARCDTVAERFAAERRARLEAEAARQAAAGTCQRCGTAPATVWSIQWGYPPACDRCLAAHARELREHHDHDCPVCKRHADRPTAEQLAQTIGATS